MSSSQRNRVTPLGDIVATPLRGAWMGNRGILHRGTEIVSFHRSDLWITCRLTYRDWRAQQWQLGHYTVLFFHDEAVSFAAGHRPCALCRRSDYHAFRDAALPTGDGPVTAKALDRLLHSERIVAGSHRRQLHPISWPEVPDGAFVLIDDQMALVLGAALVGWTPAGYQDRRSRPANGIAMVITPPAALTVLQSGYPAQIAVTARELAG